MIMKREIISGLIVDEQMSLSIEELCRACRVSREWVLELVDEGILEPRRRERGVIYFAGTSLQTIQRISRLQHDLQINLAGAAVVLDLLQEVERLRARLARFE